MKVLFWCIEIVLFLVFMVSAFNCTNKNNQDRANDLLVAIVMLVCMLVSISVFKGGIL